MDNSSAAPLLPDSSGLTKRRVRAALAVILACVVYAVVRYNVFGDVSTDSIPMYISNKAIALSAVIFLLVASHRCFVTDRAGSRFWGTASLHASAIHILMSMVLLNDTYFEQLYNVDGSLNITGGASTLAGTLAAYFYFALVQVGSRRKGPYLLKLFASAFVALHLLIMGLSGWLKMLDWPGGMPPISLLAFASALGAASFYVVASRRKKSLPEASIESS